jgi:midasin (ATPase involved in ribosome maturation)
MAHCCPATLAQLVRVLITGSQLERVNNSASTTIQDYLGTYVPSGAGFVFQPGALYRAMVHGDFFLADEFNLADPAVRV